MAKNIYSLPQTNGINFVVKYIEIEGHKHRVSLAGNKKGTPVILMMGVFEDSLADARWLVSNMVINDKESKFYFITVTVPFLEEYTVIRKHPTMTAKYDGFIPPSKIIKMREKVKIDPRFDLEKLCSDTEKDYLCRIKNKESSFCGT